jgi:DNA replication and repair protein RecF
LKASHNAYLDLTLLEIYNQELIPLAEYIHTERKKFILEIIPYFENAYLNISEEKEKFNIEYISPLNEQNYEQLLALNLEKDKILRRTTTGIHKDDLEFYMNGVKIKTFGSQGQQKTFLLALKLAQHDYLQKKLSKSVFFIIDDIFDKIDSARSKNLIKFVTEHLGQVFISYTNKQFLENKFKEIDYQLIEL